MKIIDPGLPIFTHAETSYSAGPRVSFWVFFFGSLPVVYWIGRFNNEGGALVAAWLFIFPGALFVGWFFIYKIWVNVGMSIAANKRTDELKKKFYERLAGIGKIEYLDSNVQLEAPSGLALVDGRIFAIDKFRIVEVPNSSIRGYDWSVGGTSVIGTGNSGTNIFTAELDAKERAQTDGIRIKTLDPSSPEIMLYTGDELVCKRWASIIENILRAA